ncbi:MAG: hypothetical protein AAF639_01410 [Chloroflexota bacterium]
MKKITPNLNYYGRYSDNFRKNAFQLIDWGYQDAIDKIRSTIEKDQVEDDITEAIANAIENRLCTEEGPRWLNQYTIKNESPIKSKERTGKKRQRVDILIESTSQWRPQYLFEAKRLRKNGYGIGKYIDKKGMGCFITGAYGERYDEAAMLGYVQSGTVASWKKDIWDRIDQDATNLDLNPPQKDFNTSSFNDVWLSNHDRSLVGRPIDIYHILLDCT